MLHWWWLHYSMLQRYVVTCACMHRFGDCIRSTWLTYCVMYAASDTGLQEPIIAAVWHSAVVWGTRVLMSVSVGELAATTAALVSRV